MKWYLLVLFTTAAHVEPMPDKVTCEELRAVIIASYGRGSGFVDARCVSVPDSAPKR